MLKLAVLGSGNGTSIQTCYEELRKIKKLSINLVISDRKASPLLKFASDNHIQSQYLPHIKLTRQQYGGQLDKILRVYQCDLVLLVGFMRILDETFVNQWKNQIFNIHPSLLPRHKGLMDLEVHQTVLDNHELETGCSIHEVISEVDDGRVVLQKKCPVFSNDTAQTLKQRVQQLEAESLLTFIQHRVNQYHEPATINA
jgi:phosphoribosylglycinamide formyltransferase-1